ncbi:hypothetical protein [Neisseria chenwenguii]|uniref:Uncharacterized protein n=1 Tax=Neisseria chenwenguii TaxID=1853278 RepID=A0A220RZ61_9NEIS|nr:hypothetical protein [Neisseria chenwenguii]ASK26453.1 hypothetical protein BG910_00665 [Neisseria chenwenguii]ROV55895.1 hypothetical protein EGS38_06780 [Neisseria chenwenguii]
MQKSEWPSEPFTDVIPAQAGIQKSKSKQLFVLKTLLISNFRISACAGVTSVELAVSDGIQADISYFCKGQAV